MPTPRHRFVFSLAFSPRGFAKKRLLVGSMGFRLNECDAFGSQCSRSTCAITWAAREPGHLPNLTDASPKQRRNARRSRVQTYFFTAHMPGKRLQRVIRI